MGVRSRFGEVQVGFRTVKVGAFPISIDSAELDSKARERSIRQRAKEIRAELGNPRKIMLGVDRLDYTKGIDVRLKAFSALLAEKRADRTDTVLVQLATPPAGNAWRATSRCARTSNARSATSTASTARSAAPVVHYLHRPIPPR